MHRRGPRIPVAVIGALAGLVVLAPVAEARTFGANLKRSANSDLTCREKLLVADMFGNQGTFPSGAQTCTWYTISRAYNSTAEGSIIPYNRGVLTSARLKVGNRTGRMRFVLLRAVSERPPMGVGSNQACCVEVRRSRVFRPRRNRITKKTLGWRLRGVSSFNPDTGLRYQSYYVLGLSVLSPGTPVPLHNTGRTGIEAPGAMAFFPAFKRRQERVDGLGQSGHIVLMQGRVRR